jgi:mono/diheme cytochrome c family protein
MGSRSRTWLILAISATALVGCGGGTRPAASSGRAVFTQSCSGCHSLSGKNDPRRQGGDLLNFHAPRPEMTQLVGEMPVRHPLSQAQLRAVVRFVMATENGRR